MDEKNTNVLSKTVRNVVQESNEKIVTNVTDNTTGKKRNNKKQVILVITNRGNGAQNCGGITSLHSDINSLTEERR